MWDWDGNLCKHLFYEHRSAVLIIDNSLLLSSDHLTRHEMATEESIGESGFQYCIQWLFFLILVSNSVKSCGPEAATNITFDSLKFSSTISIVSLSMGQFKVLIGNLKSFVIRTEPEPNFLFVAGTQSDHRVHNICPPKVCLHRRISWCSINQ